MHNYRKFKDYHIEQLRDPDDAKIYLSVAIEDYEKDKDIDAFLLAIRDVAGHKDVYLNWPNASALPTRGLAKSFLKMETHKSIRYAKYSMS